MKKECNIVRDLLPLYAENMVSAESSELIEGHLAECDSCRTELEKMREEYAVPAPLAKKEDKKINTDPFKRVMKRMNRQFSNLAYALVIFFIFLGFSWTGGENLMFNSLIMPIVGVFGYVVFGWRAIYKMPVLVFLIDILAALFGIVELDILATLIWSLIYIAFVFAGIAIAYLLHFSLKKE